MKTLLILISFLFLTDSNLLHQDTILKVDENGEIIGLPNEFSPAKFDASTKILRIRNRIIVFPKCITDYFEEHKNPELRLSSTWYHSKDIMPYYLNFNISDKSVNYGYTILVDLETLELIYVQKTITKGTTTYNQDIDLDEKCLNEYENGIRITY